MKLLNKNGEVKEFVDGKYPAKVLNISHTDLDGVTSAICVSNTFTDVETIYTTYGWNMDQLFAKWEGAPTVFQKYDLVIFTDVSMGVDKLKRLFKIFQIGDYQGEFVFLDHHEASKDIHNPKSNIYVLDDISGAGITKNWCETVIGVDLSHLEQLVKYTNDYDLWKHKYKQSKQLQYLLDAEFNRDRKDGLYLFQEKYMNGIDFNNLTQEQQDTIRWKENMLEDAWENLQVDVYPGTKIAFIMVPGDIINEMAQRLLTDPTFEIDLVINFPLNKLGGSMRANDIGNMNLNDFIHIIGDHIGIAGGGHKTAAGFRINDLDWKMTNEQKIKIAKPVIDKMVDYLTKTFKELILF
jgi:oligoribonuclease NrnB/cAMP/cGMP phosphodiesterase (DHH superfamily)